MVLSPDEAQTYIDMLDRREIRIPKTAAIRNAKQKLDVLAMHYMAWVYNNFNMLAYDIIDSSPQRGWNFLVTRTDEFCIPKGLTPKQRMLLNLGDVYIRRTLPLSCLGYTSRYNVYHILYYGSLSMEYTICCGRYTISYYYWAVCFAAHKLWGLSMLALDLQCEMSFVCGLFLFFSAGPVCVIDFKPCALHLIKSKCVII